MNSLLKEIILLDSSIDIFTVFIRILLAAFLGGIIGSERGKHGSQAGLRTHILVCLGSTMTSLSGIFSNEILGCNSDPLRICAQVVSGIGFLGAGMIIVKNANIIIGLTTAAGMWTTATIGISIGLGFYSAAFLLMFACVFTSAFLTRIERKRKNAIHLYIEIENLIYSGKITDEIRNILNNDGLLEIIPPKSGKDGHLGVSITTSYKNDFDALRNSLECIEGVAFSVIE